MLFLAAIVEVGAVPILSPKKLAERLRNNPIHKKDIIISRDGQTVIRVFMDDGGAFKSPISANGVIDIYPLDPKDKSKTLGVEEARALINDWEGALKRLEESEWYGENRQFYIGGIDYDFQTREGFERLVEANMQGEDESERKQAVDKLCNESKDLEETLEDDDE